MANPFSVNVPSALQSLMVGEQGYKTVSGEVKQRQVAAAREQAAQSMMQGGDSRSAIAQLMGIGDIQGAQTLAGMDQNNRDFQFRQQESTRQQGNADRSFGEQQRQFNVGAEGARVQPGWMAGPGGAMVPKPGGPADPAYIRSINEAKEKPREFSYADISKLTEEGGKFASVNGFIENFKPEYAGKPLGMGAASNWVARNAPSALTGETERNAASYWQNYDRYKNVVRNDLFGSALTATEQAAFEKADINPGMNPDIIKANLAEQQKILQGAMKRKASSLIASKYKPEAISEAYGIPLKDLGVALPGSAPPAAKQTPSAQMWTDPATGKAYKIINGVPHE